MAYTFTTQLLSAEKTGSPPQIGTALSGLAVSFLSGSNVTFLTQQVIVVSLGGTDAGIAFNPINVTVASNELSTFQISAYPLVSVTVGSSVFLIPSIMETLTFAVVNDMTGNFTTFPFLSTVATVPLSSQTTSRDVLSPQTRRLWVYGYI